ncbi:hypothetical protein [Mycobacterium sp.]|uniref:hypothetical protein n=1 Tax=Mycobacterium sp. TaxID=1785 RepID=UPI003F962968
MSEMAASAAEVAPPEPLALAQLSRHGKGILHCAADAAALVRLHIAQPRHDRDG